MCYVLISQGFLKDLFGYQQALGVFHIGIKFDTVDFKEGLCLLVLGKYVVEDFLQLPSIVNFWSYEVLLDEDVEKSNGSWYLLVIRSSRKFTVFEEFYPI